MQQNPNLDVLAAGKVNKMAPTTRLLASLERGGIRNHRNNKM